jgi:hypothetical protein
LNPQDKGEAKRKPKPLYHGLSTEICLDPQKILSEEFRKKFSPEEIDFIKRFQFHPGAGAGWPLFFWIAFGLNF